jgi:putative DNA primase/helicase
MIRHLGVEDTPLYRAIGTRFLISLVARVREPGCKVDTVPILEGVQGLLKSTILEALVEPWFTDHMPDLAGKDAQMQLRGVWLVEFAEYGQLGRADANRAKNFVTIRSDRLRRPYERVVEEQPRQCVMAVTLNRPAIGYLKDETGNRRFWPVLCGATWPEGQQIDIEVFRRERDQLLAEADQRWFLGEKWWLHEPDLIAAHEVSVADRMDVGPLYGQVAMALQSLVEKGVEEPSAHELRIAMGFGQSRPQDYREVGRVLTMLGYVGQRLLRSGVRDTFYKRVKSG